MQLIDKRARFADTDEGIEAERTLLEMVDNEAYHTTTSFSANATRYPGNRVPFVDKHLDYLSSHPETNAEHYLSNLRLMTRVR